MRTQAGATLLAATRGPRRWIGVASAIEREDAWATRAAAAAPRVPDEHNLSTARARLARALGRGLHP
jgi:hypothetical protein